MKRDRERPTAKVDRLVLRLAGMVLGSLLVLSGCGRLSLVGLLEQEQPGEFDLSPNSAALAVKTKLTVTGQGGFRPYTFDMVEPAVGTVDAASGEYTAPDSVSGDYQNAEIRGTDYFGETSTTTLKVFNPLTLSPASATIYDTQSVLFDANGGVASGGYKYYVDDVDTGASPMDGIWTFGPSPAGTYTVEVFDDLENSALATVMVVAFGGALAIDPVSVYVLQGAAVSFAGINVLGTASYTADPAVGSFSGSGDDRTYTAPDPATLFEGPVTITLSDDIDSVTATVYVISADPDPLAISPASLGEPLTYGETMIFTAVGGISPYAFTIDPDDFQGTIQTLAPPNDHQARYTAPSRNTVDWVRLTDAIGQTLRVKVRVAK